jgi:dTDP-4-dehydrorhamnose 3,5-epimerase
MNITPTKLAGVVVVETDKFVDPRGEFARLYCDSELEQVIGPRRIVQINISLTRKVGALRGLHFQYAPHEEMKLVRCLQGRVWDVVVDLRAGSPTFLEWHAEELSSKNSRMLVIPEGCAHGFQVLEEDSEMLYLHTEFYMPKADGRVRYNDPLIQIEWPLKVTEISIPDRDQNLLPSNFSGVPL